MATQNSTNNNLLDTIREQLRDFADCQNTKGSMRKRSIVRFAFCHNELNEREDLRNVIHATKLVQQPFLILR